jgi:hypothetical protein
MGGNVADRKQYVAEMVATIIEAQGSVSNKEAIVLLHRAYRVHPCCRVIFYAQPVRQQNVCHSPSAILDIEFRQCVHNWLRVHNPSLRAINLIETQVAHVFP